MACALPVVATPLAGVPEMVVDGATGFLVPQHEPSALADVLERLLTNVDLAKSLGVAGRERAEKLFAIEKSAHDLRALFGHPERSVAESRDPVV
jgi:colanic acid/amylovoran biosynthesis glycosyltransferase